MFIVCAWVCLLKHFHALTEISFSMFINWTVRVREDCSVYIQYSSTPVLLSYHPPPSQKIWSNFNSRGESHATNLSCCIVQISVSNNVAQYTLNSSQCLLKRFWLEGKSYNAVQIFEYMNDILEECLLKWKLHKVYKLLWFLNLLWRYSTVVNSYCLKISWNVNKK